METVSIPAGYDDDQQQCFEGRTALEPVNFAEGGSRLLINMNAFIFNGSRNLKNVMFFKNVTELNGFGFYEIAKISKDCIAGGRIDSWQL